MGSQAKLEPMDVPDVEDVSSEEKEEDEVLTVEMQVQAAEAGGGSRGTTPSEVVVGGCGLVAPDVAQASGTAAAEGVDGGFQPAWKVCSMNEKDGMVPICVRYAPLTSWSQKTIWVSPECNSDDLKWVMRKQLGGMVCTWRVHEGFRGHPYDRFTPLLDGAPGAADEEALRGPLVLSQSFGP